MSNGEVAREPGSTGIIWFRRDLRVHDHPALTAAVASFEKIVCLYVLDDRLLSGRMSSQNRAWFLRESLAELSGAIAARGGTLVIREGRPEAVVPAIARQVAARAVFVSRDYGPFGRARDRRVKSALARGGLDFVALPGVLAAEPEQIVNGARGAFTIFSAFLRRWHDVPRRAVLPAPTLIASPAGYERPGGRAPGGFEPTASAAASLPPGESAARARLERFIGQQAGLYAQQRDRLDLAGTSRVSQDLRWGLISPAEVVARGAGAAAGK
ncbi:MAG: deoxyribodipyrimidine photo-lyase, partial [Anaerolineaceae bacterium]